MARFLKSAAFPIIIIVLLAFFVQQMIMNRDSGEKETTFQEFVQMVKKDEVKSVVIENKDEMMTVVLKDGDRKTSNQQVGRHSACINEPRPVGKRQ